MPKDIKICKTCQYFEQIQGLFGKCVKLKFKETEYVFATNPACCQYDPIEDFNSRTAPHRNGIPASSLFFPLLADFYSSGIPAKLGMPSISNRFVKDNQPKPEEKEEWINPIFRRKHPVQKVIKIGKGADGKMRRMP